RARSRFSPYFRRNFVAGSSRHGRRGHSPLSYGVRQMKRHVVWCAALFCLGALAVADDAQADGAQRTWNFLTTGNGHGFQVYDANKNKIVTFLDHPYRYVAPRSDPRSDGIGRRNLAFDLFFGVKGTGGAGWLSAPSSAGDPEYVDQSNIIRAPVNIAGQ